LFIISSSAGILINDEFCGGHTVEYNYVYDCVKETRDHGPFNSWGRERFWSEIFNHPEYVPQGGYYLLFLMNLIHTIWKINELMWSIPSRNNQWMVFVLVLVCACACEFVGVPTQSPAGPVWHDVIWPVTIRNNFFFYYAVYDPWGAPDAIDMVSVIYIWHNIIYIINSTSLLSFSMLYLLVWSFSLILYNIYPRSYYGKDDGSSMMWAYENVCIGSSVKVGSSGAQTFDNRLIVYCYPPPLSLFLFLSLFFTLAFTPSRSSITKNAFRIIENLYFFIDRRLSSCV
jgi:hypothetical protein